jgi:cephalosporin hydroxylase
MTEVPLKSNDPIAEFERTKQTNIDSYPNDTEWYRISKEFHTKAFLKQYMYNFSILGRPIIQMPTDIVAAQELIWKVKPDLIIETGIAHGGSLIMSAAMLAQIDYCEAVSAGVPLNPLSSRRRVLGIDIDIRPHNRALIETHPMSHLIEMIQGSSIDQIVIQKVRDFAAKYDKVLVFLDSNHTQEHVLAELSAYAPLVTKGSYCCVMDSVVEDLPDETCAEKPWGKGNNPKTAVWEYLRMLGDGRSKGINGESIAFAVDRDIQNKLIMTNAPDGYLERTR